MKKLLLMLSVLLLGGANAFASEIQYNLKVDGITCPFCVATSAKALKAFDGVINVDSDLAAGLIKVCAEDTVEFTDEQLKELFLEKGFTYRGMEKLEQCELKIDDENNNS